MNSSLSARSTMHSTDLLAWVQKNRDRVIAALATLVMVIVFLAFVVSRYRTQADEAWAQLDGAQSYLLDGNFPMARKALDQWKTRFGKSGASIYARFVEADLLY